jgi:hypothetical protein
VEFQVIIQGIARLTLIFQDVLHKLRVISTLLSELEKEKGNIETLNDIAMPKFPLDTLNDFDIFRLSSTKELLKSISLVLRLKLNLFNVLSYFF